MDRAALVVPAILLSVGGCSERSAIEDSYFACTASYEAAKCRLSRQLDKYI